MDTATLPDEVQTAVERLGTADVVVGLATAGPIPALGAVAAAVRAGLEAHCGGQASAVVHVDQAPAEATPATVAAAFGDLRLISVPAGGHGEDGLDWSGAVRAVFIHDVVATPEERRAELAVRNVHLFDTYAGAALCAHRLGLLGRDALMAVAEATERELAAVGFESGELRGAREADLARDLQAIALAGA